MFTEFHTVFVFVGSGSPALAQRNARRGGEIVEATRGTVW